MAALKAADKPDAAGILKRLIESRLPKIDLVDILIDIDNQTNFLRHFLHGGDGRELNKGEASHDLSRFMCSGKEGVLCSREFVDQVRAFSWLSILHNAVVAWNMIHIAKIAAELRAEGLRIED